VRKIKIELDLPEWTEGLKIRVFAGINILAYEDPETKEVFIKYSPCERCGTCCKNLKPEFRFPTENGRCIHLEEVGEEHLCSLGNMRPFACCVYTGESNPECGVGWKKNES